MATYSCYKGKTVLVTGASSGIGATAAEYFAAQGAKVALGGRNEERLNQIADRCRKAGAEKVFIAVCDVSTRQACLDMAAKVLNDFNGVLDVLVNNAGVFGVGNTAQLTEEEVNRVLDVNLKAAMWITQACVEALAKSSLKAIVNVSSSASKMASSDSITYFVSKAALDKFTQCAAMDLISKGIRVNAVNPAGVETPLFSTVGLDVNKIKAFCEKDYPMGRMGTTEDIAAAILFLASDQAQFIMGQTIVLCGGKTVGSRTITRQN